MKNYILAYLVVYRTYALSAAANNHLINYWLAELGQRQMSIHFQRVKDDIVENQKRKFTFHVFSSFFSPFSYFCSFI